jgi:LuxR family maltose regulon positive regulatory protein
VIGHRRIMVIRVPGSCAYAGLVAPAAPANPQLIDRGALLAALDRAAARQVTVISAPAGSGKTSLLRAWVSRLGQPCRLATLTVRRDQQDAQQFWLAVLHAIRQASDHPSTPEPPAPTPAFNGPAMVNRVRSELASDPGPRVLVIDDLHELTAPDALAQLTGLLTDLPEGVHAVLATRRDLPLRLHRCAWPASLPRSARPTCASPGTRPVR